MVKELRYAAIIEIGSKILLKMLDFEGGKIHRVYLPEDRWIPDTICIVLEHPDLDKVEDGFVLRRIQPMYQSIYGDNGCLLKVERVDPPKKEARKDSAD